VLKSWVRIMARMIYEDRAIAFIDILGFTELVRSNQVSKILNSLKLIRNHLKRIETLPRAPLRSSTFSDTIVLSSKNDEIGLPYLIYSAAALVAELFLRGIFCRGGITNGELYHRSDAIFGQALIEAYYIESRLAVFPRIIVTESIVEDFVIFRNRQLSKSRRQASGSYFRLDFDNLYHLDFFSPWLFIPSRAGTIKQTVVKRVRRHIVQMSDVSENIEVWRKMSKIFWVGEYMRYVDEEHGAWHIGGSRVRRPPAPMRDERDT
jgi:hypothetical protein